IELFCPFLNGGNHWPGLSSAQLDLGTSAHVVFRLLQQIKKFLDGFAGDLRGLEQRPALISDSIDPSVGMIAVWVAEMMLQVSNDRIMPVEKVNRAIGSDIHRRGPKVRVVGLD